MSQIRSEHHAATARARQIVYALLARAFTVPPSAEVFAAWRDLASQDEAAGLLGEAATMALRDAVQPPTTGVSAEQQGRQDFMNLFKVPGGQFVAPYESVYRDAREIEGQRVSGLLMGQSAIDVQKWYRLAALEISEDYRDLPDHVGLELSYLAHLCRKESQFAASGDDSRHARAREMQRDFLAAHVAPWIGALRDNLHKKSESAYFRVVATLAVDFVRSDLAAMEHDIGPSTRSSAPAYATAPGEPRRSGRSSEEH